MALILRNRMLNASNVGARALNSLGQAGFGAMASGSAPRATSQLQRVPQPAVAIPAFPMSSSPSDRDCLSHRRTERSEKRTAKTYWLQNSNRG